MRLGIDATGVVPHGKGISRESDILDLGAQHGVLEKSGSWYSYKGERVGQGRENARQVLIERPELRQALETDLRQAVGLTGSKKSAEFELTTVDSRKASAAS